MRLSAPERIESYTASGVWGCDPLDGLLRRTAVEAPERLAITDPPNKPQIMGEAPLRLSYQQADAIVDHLADTFTTLGLARDDVVAIQLPNTAESVLTILACSRAGLIACPLPVIWREHELAKALPNIAPRALVTSQRIFEHPHADMMRNIAADLMTVRFVFGFGKDLPDGVMSLEARGSDAGSSAAAAFFSDDENLANDIATLNWSAGNADQEFTVARSHNQWVAAGLMLMLEAGLKPDSRILNPFSLTSLVPLGLMSAWLLSGGTLAQHHPFAPEVFLEQVEAEDIDFTCLPPAAGQLFDEHGAGVLNGGLKTLGCVLYNSGGHKSDPAPLGDLARSVVDIHVIGEFACLASRRLEGRLKGTIPFGEINRPTHSLDRVTLAQTKVSGSVLRSHFAAGKLGIKSPMMFDSYFPPMFDRESDERLVFDKQGFVETGYKALVVNDAEKEIELLHAPTDTFQHGGVPVAADELDNLYSSCEALSDAAALPVEDPVMGNRILAVVVPNPGMSISFEEFKDYLKARKVAPYKIPDRLVTVKTIPRGRRGEVLRDKVLDQA